MTTLNKALNAISWQRQHGTVSQSGTTLRDIRSVLRSFELDGSPPRSQALAQLMRQLNHAVEAFALLAARSPNSDVEACYYKRVEHQRALIFTARFDDALAEEEAARQFESLVEKINQFASTWSAANLVAECKKIEAEEGVRKSLSFLYRALDDKFKSSDWDFCDELLAIVRPSEFSSSFVYGVLVAMAPFRKNLFLFESIRDQLSHEFAKRGRDPRRLLSKFD